MHILKSIVIAFSMYSKIPMPQFAGGMFYPAQSGIWQTVWLERVPENYITELTVTPDYDARTVTVKAHTSHTHIPAAG